MLQMFNIKPGSQSDNQNNHDTVNITLKHAVATMHACVIQSPDQWAHCSLTTASQEFRNTSTFSFSSCSCSLSSQSQPSHNSGEAAFKSNLLARTNLPPPLKLSGDAGFLRSQGAQPGHYSTHHIWDLLEVQRSNSKGQSAVLWLKTNVKAAEVSVWVAGFYPALGLELINRSRVSACLSQTINETLTLSVATRAHVPPAFSRHLTMLVMFLILLLSFILQIELSTETRRSPPLFLMAAKTTAHHILTDEMSSPIKTEYDKSCIFMRICFYRLEMTSEIRQNMNS